MDSNNELTTAYTHYVREEEFKNRKLESDKSITDSMGSPRSGARNSNEYSKSIGAITGVDKKTA